MSWALSLRYGERWCVNGWRFARKSEAEQFGKIVLDSLTRDPPQGRGKWIQWMPWQGEWCVVCIEDEPNCSFLKDAYGKRAIQWL